MDDIKFWSMMRVCLASSKFIELQYLSLPLTMFIKNWSTSCTSSCSPNGVLNSLGKSPVAAHFHRYFSTHLGGRSRPHQFATLLCQLISNPKAIPDLRRIPTRLSTLNSYHERHVINILADNLLGFALWKDNTLDVTNSYCMFNC